MGGVFVVLCIVIIGGIAAISFAVYISSKQAESKANLEEKLKEIGFVTSKVIEADSGMAIYVDDVNKRWFIKRGRFDEEPKFFSYSDLIEFEVSEDGESIAKGRAGSAFVGGMLFGTIGAVVGASKKQVIKNVCSNLQVRICVKDISEPEIIVPFIQSETEKKSIVYEVKRDLAKSFAATLAYIESGKELGDITTENKNNAGSANELERYFELKEKGIISEEEYFEKKKQILGI